MKAAIDCTGGLFSGGHRILRSARRGAVHSERCYLVPERVAQAPPSHTAHASRPRAAAWCSPVASRRRLSRFHFCHAGDQEAGADDGRLSAGEWGKGMWSMAPTETQQLRMLEQLRRAGTQPVTLDQLRAGGFDFPAVVIGELELNGYVIERVHEQGKLLGVRLLETEAPAPTTRRRQRWRRQHSR